MTVARDRPATCPVHVASLFKTRSEDVLYWYWTTTKDKIGLRNAVHPLAWDTEGGTARMQTKHGFSRRHRRTAPPGGGGAAGAAKDGDGLVVCAGVFTTPMAFATTVRTPSAASSAAA